MTVDAGTAGVKRAVSEHVVEEMSVQHVYSSFMVDILLLGEKKTVKFKIL